MTDFFGNPTAIHIPPKFEYNQNEISITEIERKALLKGFAIAGERVLQDLNSIKRPSRQVVEIVERLSSDLKEIRKEYGHQ